MSDISQPPVVSGTPQISFTWSPHGSTFSYSAGTSIYATTAFTTAVNTAITFTAATVMPPGVVVAEYLWDLGDGTIAYGNPVAHTYKIANPQLAVALTVTDSTGRRTFGRQQLYLS